VLRRTLGEETILSLGDELRLSDESLRCDVREFEDAIESGDAAGAVALYRGAFLDGFFVSRAPEFERWAESERRRLARSYAEALERLATGAADRGDHNRAIEWWRKLAGVEPCDARIAVALMEAFAAAGDRVGALNHARVYTALVLEEFGIAPDHRVSDLELSLRFQTAPPEVQPVGAGAASPVSPESSQSGETSLPAPPLPDSGRRRGRPIVVLGLALAGIVLIVAATNSLDLRRRGPRSQAAPLHASVVGERLPNSPARALYLEGRAQLEHHREPDTRAAIATFRDAISHDSNFALAHAGLAIAGAEMHLRFSSPTEAPAWGDLAVREARRALELDSSLAEVHEALAAVHRKTEFDWDGTISESRRALALDKRAAMPHFYIGGALYHLGLLEQAERAVHAGLELNAVADRTEALRTLGTVALAAGRYREAVSLFQDVQRLSDRPVSDPHLAAAYYYSGDTSRAVALLETLRRSTSASAASRARALLASIAAAGGNRARAESLLAQTTAGQMDHHVAYSIGAANAVLGRPRDAVRWLRVAAETGFRCYPWYARDPLLASLRGDADFEALLRELSAERAVNQTRYRGAE
jgi:tetratricopeptide (TPR) repeat protein